MSPMDLLIAICLAIVPGGHSLQTLLSERKKGTAWGDALLRGAVSGFFALALQLIALACFWMVYVLIDTASKVPR